VSTSPARGSSYGVGNVQGRPAQGLRPWIGPRADGPFSVWTARFGAATRLGRRYPAKQGRDEHQELLDALRARDPERAEELMRTHTRRTGEQFLSLAEQTAQSPPVKQSRA
jgi:hypothetical protein